MLRASFILFTTAIIFTSCSQKKSAQVTSQKNTEQNSFFPVTQYLLGQIKELQSLPVTPLKITTIKEKSDSVWMKKNQVDSFVKAFIKPVIDSVSLYKYFTEKSFLDQTINAITLSYEPINQLPDTIPIKRWDVYIDPATNKVTRIYIVKESAQGTFLQTIQLTWKADHFCQVTTIAEKNDAPSEVKQEKLTWNFDD